MMLCCSESFARKSSLSILIRNRCKDEGKVDGELMLAAAGSTKFQEQLAFFNYSRQYMDYLHNIGNLLLII